MLPAREDGDLDCVPSAASAGRDSVSADPDIHGSHPGVLPGSGGGSALATCCSLTAKHSTVAGALAQKAGAAQEAEFFA
jgi:hypothetical protein